MIRIKNWEKFQHYKDRDAKWIKLYASILNQRDINVLSDRSFRILIGLWLLGGESTGKLPSLDDISFRLRFPKPVIEKALEELSPFLLQDDSDMLADCEQSDCLDKKRIDNIKKKREEPIGPMSDAEFIEKLKSNAAYKGVDIDRELAKMDAWLMTPRGRTRQKTQQFIINWLNKCDTIVHTPASEGEQMLRRILK